MPTVPTSILLIRRSVCLLLVLALAGCNTAAVAPTASPAATAQPGVMAPTAPTIATLQPAPLATPIAPTSTRPPTEVPLATLTAELSATIVAALPPSPTPEQAGGVSSGIEGIKLLPLSGGDANQPLWAAYSYGSRNFEPQQNHFVAIYSRSGGTWRELGRAELKDTDFLMEEGVKQVQIAPGRIWLEAQGGAGAHSGVYTLLSFDGVTLRTEAEHGNSSPLAGALEDLDGDGTLEVVLNNTDNYVFCYACGVRLRQFQVLRWDGSNMVEQQLATLPDTASAQLRNLNNQAVTLAQAELWKDAQITISQGLALDARNPVVKTNAMLIRLHAEARADQVREGPYPLLDNLFYGDYNGALDVLRPHDAAALFGRPSVVVSGTVAEGFESSLTYYLTATTTLALKAKPDLAPAYFLRGWGLHVTEPDNPQVLADIEQAARLDPQEKLFTESLAYLKKRD